LCGNIQEHSQSEDFWLCSQYWNSNGDLEICLIDNGIGFAGSYENVGIPIKDDIDAI
jgi:hypothetical protein